MSVFFLLPWNTYINVKWIVSSNTYLLVEIYSLTHSQLGYGAWANALLMIKPRDSSVCWKFQAPVMEVTGPQHYFVYKHQYSWKINLCSHLVCHSSAVGRKMEKKMELLIFFTLIRTSGREGWIWDETWESSAPSRQQAHGKNASVLVQEAVWFTFKLRQCSLNTFCTLQYNTNFYGLCTSSNRWQQ